jgi:hypothetical protein
LFLPVAAFLPVQAFWLETARVWPEWVLVADALLLPSARGPSGQGRLPWEWIPILGSIPAALAMEMVV